MLTLQVIEHIGSTYPTKTEQAMRSIQASGYWSTRVRDDIVLSLGIAPSTVYTALRRLRDMDCMEGNQFIGRWIKPEEVAALFDEVPSLWQCDEMAQQLYTTPEIFYQATRWAEQCRVIERVNGGSYGTMYVRSAIEKRYPADPAGPAQSPVRDQFASYEIEYLNNGEWTNYAGAHEKDTATHVAGLIAPFDTYRLWDMTGYTPQIIQRNDL